MQRHSAPASVSGVFWTFQVRPAVARVVLMPSRTLLVRYSYTNESPHVMHALLRRDCSVALTELLSEIMLASPDVTEFGIWKSRRSCTVDLIGNFPITIPHVVLEVYLEFGDITSLLRDNELYYDLMPELLGFEVRPRTILLSSASYDSCIARRVAYCRMGVKEVSNQNQCSQLQLQARQVPSQTMADGFGW